VGRKKLGEARGRMEDGRGKMEEKRAVGGRKSEVGGQRRLNAEGGLRNAVVCGELSLELVKYVVCLGWGQNEAGGGPREDGRRTREEGGWKKRGRSEASAAAYMKLHLKSFFFDQTGRSRPEAALI
jgi:hypothetical protein